MNDKLCKVNCANLIENGCIITNGCTWSLRYILEFNEAMNAHDRCYMKCMDELLSKSRWNMLILTEFGLLVTRFAFCWWYTKWRILGFLIGVYMAFWARRFSSLVREVISNKFSDIVFVCSIRKQYLYCGKSPFGYSYDTWQPNVHVFRKVIIKRFDWLWQIISILWNWRNLSCFNIIKQNYKHFLS